VSDAISDTSPILHLHEINRLDMLGIFERIFIPALVADELRFYEIEPQNLGVQGVSVSVQSVSTARRDIVLTERHGPSIQPADAEVFTLSQDDGFQKPVLTDDLILRRRLESHGAIVVGTVGVLVRAYQMGKLERSHLESSIDTLFDRSTLRLSRAFRAYIRQLLSNLP
jgi:predicted nucleic acid-binding protein